VGGGGKEKREAPPLFSPPPTLVLTEIQVIELVVTVLLNSYFIF
jgi:hypothetical protein